MQENPLLSVLTSAKPKITDYLYNIKTKSGIVAYEIFNFVIADIPGIIEGAAEGKDWDIIFYVILNVILPFVCAC
jgi:GTP-binding protein